MENLALEIFDLVGTGSQFATLDEGASISITDTSEIFASGDVWSFSFTLNVFANAHIFGTTGEIHGGRLHEQVDHRRARLWVGGLPIYLGYLKLGDEVDVKANGDVSVSFESGHKTFDDMIEGMSAQDVSVGDVVIGIALNRKRTISATASGNIHIRGLGFPEADSSTEEGDTTISEGSFPFSGTIENSSYTSRWPKLVLSKGVVTDSLGMRVEINRTNVDHPYDAAYPCCNVNLCYQKKVLNGDNQEEKVRGYYLRLGYGENTVLGGEGETRFNNAPNFFLLHWLKRLFIDKGIIIEENQMMNVDDLRRVFLANLGCFYEEMDTDNDKDELAPGTPERARYGLYSFPENFIVENGVDLTSSDDFAKIRLDNNKVQIRKKNAAEYSDIVTSKYTITDCTFSYRYKSPITGYKAYATGKNYPKVDAKEIIRSVEAAFGVRFLFDKDYTKVRIILLRNVFQDTAVQDIECEVIEEFKTENSIRGFILSYGGSDDDTNYNYSDWSKLETDKSYDYIKEKCVQNFNKRCYLTPNNGNAYRIKIDEDEATLYPVLTEVAGYADARDGDCSGEDDTIQTVNISAKPLLMNDVDGNYAVFFSGDMKAPGENEVPPCYTPISKFGGEGEEADLHISFYSAQDKETQQQIDALYLILSVIPDDGSMKDRTMQAAIEKSIRELEDRIKSGGGGSYSEDYKIKASGEVFVAEGYKINLQDNYDFTSNDGTPFDEASIGLCFGVMRGSGLDSFVAYEDDLEEKEGNDYWEINPGDSVVDHPDTCDNWGNRWGTDSAIDDKDEVPQVFANLFPLRDRDYFQTIRTYGVGICDIRNAKGEIYHVLMKLPMPVAQLEWSPAWQYYIGRMFGCPDQVMMDLDSIGISPVYPVDWNNLIIELDSNNERLNTLIQLIQFYNGIISGPVVLHNGVSTRYSRFSLKPRAEKQNPDFDPKKPESASNPRFVADITDPNLQRRGLMDQFYKEYSYWIRNARIVTKKVNMTLAQLLSIDKTKRIRIGDVTGYVRKIQYTVSNKTGLGPVTLEIMYI